MNRSLRKGLLATAICLVSLATHADVVTVAPAPGAAIAPADPTAHFTTSPELTRARVVVREVAPVTAVNLLESTEGPSWRVLEVRAPVCNSTHSGRECRLMKGQCDRAKKFIKKHGGKSACSELYDSTTVLLANDKQNPLHILGE